MEKTCFYTNQHVFDFRYGWGIVFDINFADTHPVEVYFLNVKKKYLLSGKENEKDEAPLLRLMDYTIKP